MRARAGLVSLMCQALLCGCLATPDRLPTTIQPAFDLDGNGIPDTALRIAPCQTSPQSSCIVLTSVLTQRREIRFPGWPVPCSPPSLPATIEDIGDHVNGPLHEIASFQCLAEGGDARPSLMVVDIEGGKIIGETAAPEGHTRAYWNWPRDPSGRKYPFLAPTYGDGLPSEQRVWGYLCLFQPFLPSDAICGDGFVRVDTRPASDFFREYGGYVQDLDGDGWEDIHLLFHRLVYAVSTRLGAPLATTEYDIAAATEPTAPKWFHAGRNYGAHASSLAADGSPRTVMIGGVPVGSFDDMNCNVSRFIGLLESRPGQPATRRLQWSRYYGFASTTFESYAPDRADHPEALVARPADYLNGCLHYPADSRSHMAGEPIIVFNRFAQEAPVARCIWEQYQLYLPPAWTEDKQQRWHRCFDQNLHAPGTWSADVLRERDGARLVESSAQYIWGMSDQFHPTGERLYLIEAVAPEVRSFDLRRLAAPRLTVRALERGQWIDRGLLPSEGRPKLRKLRGMGARGHGSASYFAELIADDVDGDGLKEFQLEDGTWIGWSKSLGTWAVKGRTAYSP